IVAQPGSTNVPLGNPVTFQAVADGTPPLRYQWRRNGVNIPGQTNSSLSLPHVQVEDGGTYTVIVGNDFGTVISDPAHLIVAITPVQASDNFAGAVRITGSDGIVPGANTFAT